MTIIKEEKKMPTFQEISSGEIFYSTIEHEYYIKIEETTESYVNAICLKNGSPHVFEDYDKILTGESKLIVNF